MLEAPLPVSATYSLAADVLTVTWDQPLRPGVITPGNWNACPDLGLDRRRDSVPGGTILGNITTVPMVASVDICFDLDKWDYDATPQDVVGLRGTPAAPVVNFPFIQVP